MADHFDCKQRKAFWQDRRVFVTGCTGFLGSWLTAELVANGADVIGLVRDHAPQAQFYRNGMANRVTIVKGRLEDYALLERVLAEYEVDTIFHLAAQTIVGIANRSPLSTFETNVRGTWLLLEAARRNPTTTRIVVASSEKAYGHPQYLPFSEAHPLHGRHPYDVSKSAVDLIAQSYASTYQLPVVISRFSNLFGGGDLNWNRLIPGSIRSVLRGQRPLIRSDGSFKRDYVYVEDAVRAYMMLAELFEDRKLCGQALNFGSGCPVSALDVVKTIVRISPSPILTPVILDEVKNEIRDEYLSSELAEKLVGWQPLESLETGLVKTMAWYDTFLIDGSQNN